MKDNCEYVNCLRSLGVIVWSKGSDILNHGNKIDFLHSPLMRKLEINSILNRLNKPADIFFINESFHSDGSLRDNALKRRYGDRWIKVLVDEAKKQRQCELWITDMSPRNIRKWEAIRAYVKEHRLDIDGIGVQVHVDIGRGIVPDFLVKTRMLNFVKMQSLANREVVRKIAFSEVSVLPGEKSKIKLIGKWYRDIERLGDELKIDWLFYWSPTDYESWHWNKGRLQPCGVFNMNYNDRRLVIK